MVTTSKESAVVTLRPSISCAGMPSFSESSVAILPPPCTNILAPLSAANCSINAANFSALSNTFPPILTTLNFPMLGA